MTARYRNHAAWIFAAAYVFLVLAGDALITRGADWPVSWWKLHFRLRGFELFKFAAWCAIPVLISLPRMDWSWFGVRPWRRGDWLLLALLVIACLLAVLAIPLFPSLAAVYSGVPSPDRRAFLVHELFWLASWLPGWEFLHRYFLLRPVSRAFPRYGWLLIPVSEGLYHLQKPLPEMLGMVVFSLVLTGWAMRRQNMLLPFLAHLAIELELIVFLLLI